VVRESVSPKVRLVTQGFKNLLYGLFGGGMNVRVNTDILKPSAVDNHSIYPALTPSVWRVEPKISREVCYTMLARINIFSHRILLSFSKAKLRRSPSNNI
jgi:hypothetical protein